MPVVQFPEKRKVEVTRERLHSIADQLEEIYTNLERVHSMLHTLEEESSRLEKSYNGVFKDYVNQFEDHEDIELRLVNYSTEALIVETKEGHLQIQFLDEEETTWD